MYTWGSPLGGNGGGSVAHSCHTRCPQSATPDKNSRQLIFIKSLIQLLLSIATCCDELVP